MLSSIKLRQYRESLGMSVDALADGILPTNLPPERIEQRRKELRSAIQNWEKSLFRPQPSQQDIRDLARALGVEAQDLLEWSACHRFAPIAPRKVRLVADLIRGRTVQDALDVLKFANKRAAVMVDKVLRSAIANADEQEADIERLYVSEARVDKGPVRPGTRRWRPKDRGRAVPFTRLSSHIHVSVDME
jgi:large subunit ribosomal protein L22